MIFILTFHYKTFHGPGAHQWERLLTQTIAPPAIPHDQTPKPLHPSPNTLYPCLTTQMLVGFVIRWLTFSDIEVWSPRVDQRHWKT